MFGSHQNSYVEILMPNVMILEVRVFGRYLGYESGVLINKISVLIKEEAESPCPFHHIMIQ